MFQKVESTLAINSMPKACPVQIDGNLSVGQIDLALAPNNIKCEASPFLKWAGGKSQLLAQLDQFLPSSFNRYVEPFLGGGAVFFHVRAKFPEIPCLLCDNNDELINCYQIVRDRPEDLMVELDEHQLRFADDPVTYYYRIRARQGLAEPIERAARMIFLNKTCFNGLWRVNSKGEFNVPIGSNRKAKLYDRQNLLAASQALHGTELICQDFQTTLASVGSGDFVYIDPPYHPVSRTAYFTAYTKETFGSDQQHRLAALFHKAARRGAKLMLSNSSTDLVHRLYARYKILPVRARRMINSQGDRRGAVAEVAVIRYPRQDYITLVNQSARAWLIKNKYAEVAEMIDGIISGWQRKGKRTRRNWWDVLAGSRKGRPVVVEGCLFPILTSARIRKGFPLVKGAICRNRTETIPSIVDQLRWNKSGTRKHQPRRSQG